MQFTPPSSGSGLPDDQAFKSYLRLRHLRGALWSRFFSLSLLISLLVLLALLTNVINNSAGYRAIRYQTDPAVLADGADLGTLSNEQLAAALVANLSANRPLVIVRDQVLGGEVEDFTSRPMRDLMESHPYPAGTDDLTIRDLTPEQIAELLALNFDHDQLLELVYGEVVGLEVVEVWTLSDSVLNEAGIRAQVDAASGSGERFENIHLEFVSWLTPKFLTQPMSNLSLEAGVRTALLGSLWLVFLTALFAFPIGVGAAIYLEEYAENSRLNRLIEVNIRNLAGVPSIIYGLLGLAVFVRVLGGLTGGRTLISGALTMALLILPIIIINAQEALRAVPYSIREASFGLGATRWQTIWHQVIPAALPGILTGTILAMSRAIGETAPLIVIGAATYITFDPSGPTSKFTAMPIQIYDWAKRAQGDFRALSSSTILVLLVVLVLMNASAIFLRQRFRKQLQG